MNDSVYAVPHDVTDVSQCYFYHTADIPGYGHVDGQWDLRGGMQEYLGHVDFKGKRVLEVGTASGFICFHMEKQGAEVVACDLSENDAWDIVPFATLDYSGTLARCRQGIKTQNNAYWFCHKANQSRARVVHGSVYAIPDGIGKVDISTFCSVLLHMRDPFLALATALRLTEETVVVTDLNWSNVIESRPNRFQRLKRKLFGAAPVQFAHPCAAFSPVPQAEFDPNGWDGWTTWWLLNPEVVCRFLGVLGFEKTEVSFHKQKYLDGHVGLFTVVGKRTRQSDSTNEFIKLVRQSMREK